MSSDACEVAPPKAVAVVKQAVQQKQDETFFGMFYLPSSQSFDEDVHLTSSSYVPFQGAASAASVVMGGILSVLDTAIAVMNEEFDTALSDSNISDKVDDDDGLQNRGSCVASESSVMRCCRKTERSSTYAGDAEHASTGNEDQALKNSEQYTNCESESNADNMSIESNSQEKNYVTPQNSRIGRVSTFELYENSDDCTMKPLLSDQNSMPMNNVMENRRKDEIICKDLMSPDSGIRENEEDEYCIIRNESEMHDGWLVLSDD